MSYSAFGLLSVSTGMQKAATQAQAITPTENVSQVTHQLAVVQQSQAAVAAFKKLDPIWLPLPMGPYPPAVDNSNFPRTGDPSLIVNQSQVNAQQAAEPAAVMQGMVDSTEARIPKINHFFWIGAGCLGLWWLIKR